MTLVFHHVCLQNWDECHGQALFSFSMFVCRLGRALQCSGGLCLSSLGMSIFSSLGFFVLFSVMLETAGTCR